MRLPVGLPAVWCQCVQDLVNSIHLFNTVNDYDKVIGKRFTVLKK
jgi:hypothetical protein